MTLKTDNRGGIVRRRLPIRSEQILVVVFLAIFGAVSLPSFPADPSDAGTTIGLAGTYGVIGALLALRRPRNPIGWIFLAVLLIFGLTGAADAMGGRAVVAGASLPGGPPLVLIWFESWAFPVAFVLIGAVTIVFPSGHLPGGRSGRAARAAFFAIPPGIALIAFGPYLAGVYSAAHVPNPFALLPIPDDLWIIPYLLSVAFLVAAVVSIVVRFHRARGVVRQQLKWVVAALALAAALIVGTLAIVDFVESPGAGPGTGPWIVAAIGIILIPLAVAIAILRYRLFEIDRIISRTISWAAVTVVLASVFILLVLGLQTLVAPLTRSNSLAVVLSTLVVAALFQPLRRWFQQRVDRRFNRARYDGERELAAFGTGLRDKLDLARVSAEITETVERTLQPVSVSLWLRERGSLTLRGPRRTAPVKPPSRLGLVEGKLVDPSIGTTTASEIGRE